MFLLFIKLYILLFIKLEKFKSNLQTRHLKTERSTPWELKTTKEQNECKMCGKFKRILLSLGKVSAVNPTVDLLQNNNMKDSAEITNVTQSIKCSHAVR